MDDSKSLAAILSSLPVPAGLKRKSPGDANAFGPPTKVLKQGMSDLVNRDRNRTLCGMIEFQIYSFCRQTVGLSVVT